MAKRLVEAKDFLLRQIIDNNNYTKEEKKREIYDRKINRDYLQKYCSTEIDFVKLPKSGVVKNFTALKYAFKMQELINLAVDKKLYCENRQFPTTIEKFDLCFERNLVEEHEMLKQYRERDLRELVNRKNYWRPGKPITTGKILFTTDWEYLVDSHQNAFNLRNVCIQKHLVSHTEFGKIPQSCRFYEEKLNYVPIRRDMKTYVKLDAIYHGWDRRGDSTYFEFFSMESYPEDFRNYIRMQERNPVDEFNMRIDECYNSVVENIEYMVKDRDNYYYSEQDVISEYFLKIKHPEVLQEIEYDGKFDDPRKIRLKVDEILRLKVDEILYS